eukprot:COSAG01_NODE_23269_length_821_cov_1.628809_1_plen_178_part_10
MDQSGARKRKRADVDNSGGGAAGVADSGARLPAAAGDSGGWGSVPSCQTLCMLELGGGRGRLFVSKGSAVHFGGGTTWPPESIAIVNAANSKGLGGGGIDRAINDAGGDELARDRRSLPENVDGERIATGQAVATGPKQYGRLHANTVIHAVGPDFRVQDRTDLLRGAYCNAMAEADR